MSAHAAWGGSEELWSATAALLARRGHDVTVYKGGVDAGEPRITEMRTSGCSIVDLAASRMFPRGFRAAIARFRHFEAGWQVMRLWLALSFSRRPHLTVISQGGNTDGMRHANVCRRLSMAYVLVAQKASDLYWPTDERLELFRRIYRTARWCFFVSAHNRRLTEEQLALDLPHASVVHNPFLVRWSPRTDWPEEESGLRLACVGRLHPMEKGQDMLLRVLARPKWRTRALSVTFFGAGDHGRGLEALAGYLRLQSVSFGGFVRDVASIWKDHHGLVLPSRCEGMPLVLVEAMLSARVPIVTDIAGARELVDDNAVGFLAAAPTEDSLDEALERAWSRRSEWRAIGIAAGEHVRTRVPSDPAEAFADAVERVASQIEAFPARPDSPISQSVSSESSGERPQ